MDFLSAFTSNSQLMSRRIRRRNYHLEIDALQTADLTLTHVRLRVPHLEFEWSRRLISDVRLSGHIDFRIFRRDGCIEQSQVLLKNALPTDVRGEVLRSISAKTAEKISIGRKPHRFGSSIRIDIAVLSGLLGNVVRHRSGCIKVSTIFRPLFR